MSNILILPQSAKDDRILRSMVAFVHGLRKFDQALPDDHCANELQSDLQSIDCRIK